MDIIGEYKANKGKSTLKINNDGTYSQEVYVNGQFENNSGKWDVLKPDIENNIRLRFSKFVLHMRSPSINGTALNKPIDFIAFAEKYSESNIFSSNEGEYYISICHISFCFIK